MTSTTSPQAIEADVREFAREFPTPNALRAVALCEAGTIEWAKVYEIFRRAAAAGIEAVS